MKIPARSPPGDSRRRRSSWSRSPMNSSIRGSRTSSTGMGSCGTVPIMADPAPSTIRRATATIGSSRRARPRPGGRGPRRRGSGAGRRRTGGAGRRHRRGRGRSGRDVHAVAAGEGDERRGVGHRQAGPEGGAARRRVELPRGQLGVRSAPAACAVAALEGAPAVLGHGGEVGEQLEGEELGRDRRAEVGGQPHAADALAHHARWPAATRSAAPPTPSSTATRP